MDNKNKSIRFFLILLILGVCFLITGISMILYSAYLKDVASELVFFNCTLSYMGWAVGYLAVCVTFFSALAVKFELTAS